MVKLEETVGVLGSGEQPTDYLLCNGDSDLLPALVKKDEIRFTYNQYKNTWSYVSCTIFAAMGMLSDLINYEFSYDQIKEVDDLSYTKGRIKWQGWYVQSAVKLVADRYNNSKLSETYWKVAYYRLSKYDNEIIEDVIDKLYTIDGNLCPTTEYNQDKRDWMIDGTEFWKKTNWHSVDVIKKSWQRSVKDSWNTHVIYGLKNKLSEISNFWPYFYVYVLVKNNLEEIKRLNEFKTTLLLAIEQNSKLRHLTNQTSYKEELHNMNELNRKKLDQVNKMLESFS